MKILDKSSIKEARKDFEDETIVILKDYSESIPRDNYKVLDKVKEIKKKKRKKIERNNELKKYLGGLAGIIESILNSIKITASAIIISSIWGLLEFRNRITQKNLEFVEKAKYNKKAGDDKLRNYFREQWNKSLDKTDFVAAVIFMTLMNDTSKNLYLGSLELYQEGMEEYFRSGSKLSALKTAYSAGIS